MAQLRLLLLLLLASWCVMVLTHEIGHLLGGWLGGGRLVECDLAPWRLPYSFHNPDPRPKLTLWAGPLVGVLAPLLVATAIRHRWSWFIADFCLLANGVYLALAGLSGERLLDTPRMIVAGVHPLWIVSFCFVTIGMGYLRFRKDVASIVGIRNR